MYKSHIQKKGSGLLRRECENVFKMEKVKAAKSSGKAGKDTGKGIKDPKMVEMLARVRTREKER